jgi:SAM-dependent methyltransferase
MLQEAYHPRFLELLIESDRELLKLDLCQLKQYTLTASSFKENGFWSDALVEYIESSEQSQMIQFHWIAEQHYAAKFRDPTLNAQFDHYYLIGYARIISLMMRYHINMGHDSDDLFFIVGFLESVFGEPKDNVEIFEIGTGPGELLAELIELGYRNLEGIDITASSARLARAAVADTIGEDRVHWLSFDDFQEQYPDKRYDVIIQSNLIEHIPPHKLDDFLGGIHTHLKPDGYMVVITPSRLSGPHDITRSFRPAGSEPVGFHLWEFDLTTLEKILSAAGFGRFMTVRSLPAPNYYWDSVPTEESFCYKRDMEQFLWSLDWKLRKPIVDGMYFKGVVCQKLPGA